MLLKSAGIVGTGLYVPKEIRTNAWFMDDKRLSLRKDDDVQSLQKFLDDVGLKERRICAKNEKITDMEANALLSAVDNAGISIRDIDMILDGPGLHEQPQPGNASLLQHKAGAVNAAAMNLELSCASMISQIIVANAMITSGLYNTVACVVSTNWSKIGDYTTRSPMFLGDGAAAIIMQPVSERKGVLGVHVETKGQYHFGLGINSRLPRALIRDYHSADYSNPPRERLFLYMNEEHPGFKEAGSNSAVHVARSARLALNKANLSVEDVDWFLPTQPSKSLADSWREELGIPLEKMHITFEKYANMSSAAMGANLHEALVEKKIKDGDVVLMAAVGAGTHYAAVVLHWGK